MTRATREAERQRGREREREEEEEEEEEGPLKTFRSRGFKVRGSSAIEKAMEKVDKFLGA